MGALPVDPREPPPRSGVTAIQRNNFPAIQDFLPAQPRTFRKKQLYSRQIIGRLKMIIEAGGHFSLAAIRFSNREAVRCDGKSRSFRELRDAANRIGSAVASLPVSRGGRVGVLSHNRIEVVELWLGLERFNLVRVVLHSHFEMATHVETLDEVGAEVLVFDARFAEQVEKHRHSLRSVKHLICIGDPAPSWAMRYEALQANGRPEDPHIEIDEEAP